MPAIAPIALTLGTSTETYNPASSNGTKSTFTDVQPGRMADWRVLNVTVRPAGKTNAGHLVEILMVRPVPVQDQSGCCVDKDAPSADTIRITTLLSKESNPARATALVQALSAVAGDAAIQAVIKGGSFY